MDETELIKCENYNFLSHQSSFVFRLNDNGQGPELLRQVFLERGWQEFNTKDQYDYDWNLWWRTTRFRSTDYETIYHWQRLNHYPKSTLITKKDALARNLKRMRCVHGARVFNFIPLSFNLPNDYTKFVNTYGTYQQKKEGKMPLWICKPADLSRGRGIFIFRDLSELVYDCNAVVQLYIENPLLIGGYKFDLRIYVAVISFMPLRVYIYEEGIARFSTEKYDLKTTRNVFAHLTNTSINKHSPGYSTDKECVGSGCKWTLAQLRHYFLSININDQLLWQHIINIVILTLLVQAPQVPKVDNCFELYGFDILIDQNLKPWLLEVNFSPSLSSDCQADIIAKKSMLHDLLDLLHFKYKDAERGGEIFRHHFKIYTEHSGQSLLPRSSAGNRRQVGHSRKPFTQRKSSAWITSTLKRTDAEAKLPDTLHGYDESVPLQTGEMLSSAEGQREETQRETSATDPAEAPLDTARPSTQSYGSIDSVYLDTLPIPHLTKASSKTTISAESHMSRESRGSEGSKVSSDSGIGSIPKSANNATRTLSEATLKSASSYSGKNGHGRKEGMPHLPSLGKIASSRHNQQPRKFHQTPSQSSNNHDKHSEKGRSGQRCVKPVQNHSTFQSSKSMCSLRNGSVSQELQPHDVNYPIVHRSLVSQSVTSVRSNPFTNSMQPTQFKNPSTTSSCITQKDKITNIKPQPRVQVKNARHGSFGDLKKQVGSFYLVFPFNETTHRMSMTTLDPRVVICETQRVVKALKTVNATACTDCNGNKRLWAPLKMPIT